MEELSYKSEQWLDYLSEEAPTEFDCIAQNPNRKLIPGQCPRCGGYKSRYHNCSGK